MLNEKNRMKSGDMAPELIAAVDSMMDEFMAAVDFLAEERHLQKGIARSQLPCSMVAILDKQSLFIIGQMRMENRLASYFYRQDMILSLQQAASSARWEFHFEDAFIIQFPAGLLKQSAADRRQSLRAIASDHIDSEFLRFQQMLGLMRTRPIFGTAGQPEITRTLLLLLPEDPGLQGNEQAVTNAIEGINLAVERAGDIRAGRSAVRELWLSINYAGAIIADLTGTDATVMYGLGIAHTLGKETVLIHPQGSKYLRDIPKTYSIEYKDDDAGRAKMEEELSTLLAALLAPVVED